MSWFMIGAAISGLIGTYCIQAIIKHSRIKEDTAIGLVLSVFFGFGIVLLTYVQHHGKGNQAGLDSFIFGQAAAIVGTDVQIISVIAFVLIFITFLLFKELKLITFDPQFAQGLGLPVKWLNGLLMTLIVGAVVIGLQAVGVILMAAMLIIPAATARRCSPASTRSRATSTSVRASAARTARACPPASATRRCGSRASRWGARAREQLGHPRRGARPARRARRRR
jgi:ABC-type Mn2+/Zn2+ transport system permease subunit